MNVAALIGIITIDSIIVPPASNRRENNLAKSVKSELADRQYRASSLVKGGQV